MLHIQSINQSINQALGPPWVFAQPRVHRPRTQTLHLTLSLDILSMSFHVCFVSAKSFMTSLLHVFLGFPCFLFPCGFHIIACLAILFSGFLSVSNPSPLPLLYLCVQQNLVC